MTAIIRTINMGLPRVSMARIPMVAFANNSHPSAYSSSSWSESAKNAADKLENSAKNLANEVNIPFSSKHRKQVPFSFSIERTEEDEEVQAKKYAIACFFS
jgi:hypothetical protein